MAYTLSEQQKKDILGGAVFSDPNPEIQQAYSNFVGSNAAGSSPTNAPITGATLQSQPDLSTSLPQAPTDSTNYQGIIAGGQTLADYFRNAGASLAEKPTDLTASFNKLYSDLGIGAKEEKAGESQKSLDLLNAQMAGLSAEAQGVPIRLQEESQGRGITTGGLAPLQAGELRKIALRSLPLQGQILAQQAVATGDQRALSAAQEKFNQSFQIVQKDEQRQYDFRKEQRDRIFDFLSNAEKEKLQALQKKDDREFTTMQNNLNFAQDLTKQAITSGQAELAAKISALDPKSTTYQQDLASLAGQIRPQKVSGVPDGTKDSLISPYQEEREYRTVQSVNELLLKATQNPGIFGKSAAIPLPLGLRSSAFRDFKAELDTLKSNIAFSELTAMREASKTGGALGQVSDKETKLLESALGALSMSQSPENVQKQLEKIRDSINRWRVARNASPISAGVTTGRLVSPDGKQEVSLSDLTPEQIEEAKNAGWK